jgi:hypothetical protein
MDLEVVIISHIDRDVQGKGGNSIKMKRGNGREDSGAPLVTNDVGATYSLYAAYLDF